MKELQKEVFTFADGVFKLSTEIIFLVARKLTLDYNEQQHFKDFIERLDKYAVNLAEKIDNFQESQP